MLVSAHMTFQLCNRLFNVLLTVGAGGVANAQFGLLHSRRKHLCTSTSVAFTEIAFLGKNRSLVGPGDVSKTCFCAASFSSELHSSERLF